MRSRFGGWLARLLVPPADRDTALADLEDLHARRTARDGRRTADRRYWGDLLSLARLRFAGAARVGSSRLFLRDACDDVGAALRGFRRRPGFHLLAAGTLALGIGSAAAVFGMVNQLVLRPLPGVEQPRQAAYIQFIPVGEPAGRGRGLSLPGLEEVRRGATLVQGIASYGAVSAQVAIGEARPALVNAEWVYGDYFEVLGTRAAAGRLLRADETGLHGDSRIAVISGRLQSRLFGNRSAVGRTLLINDVPVTVIGVAAGGFQGAERDAGMDLWLPLGALVPLLGTSSERLLDLHTSMHESFVTRVAPGASTAAVEAQLAGLMARVPAMDAVNRDYIAGLRPVLFEGLHLRPAVRERTRASLQLLAGVVLLVLLMACANVANLLLLRNTTQRASLATRRALGAATGRLVLQHLAESLVLGLSGALLGLALAWPMTLPFRGEGLQGMPTVEPFMVDLRVLTFAAAAAVVTAVLFGVVPAALAGRFDPGDVIRAGGIRDPRALAGARWVLAAGQVALCLTLMVGAALLVRTLHNLYSADTGFDVDNVATLSVNVAGDSAAREARHRDLVTALAAVRGVEHVAIDLYGPHGSMMRGRAAQSHAAPDDWSRVNIWPVSPAWFDVYRVQLLHGRAFTDDEWQNHEPDGVILSASLARRLFGTTDVAGRRVRISLDRWQDVEIVGVTRDLRSARAPDEDLDIVFTPAIPGFLQAVTAGVRLTGYDERIGRDLLAAAESVLPGVPVPEPDLLTQRLHRIRAEDRLFTRLLVMLATMGILLAGIGLYGVVAFTAAARVREFGIRLALGAQTSAIAALVATHALRIAATGTATGLLGAWILARTLSNRLFGVEQADPASYAAAVAGFALVALAACWMPARVAVRADPVQSLRAQ